MNTQWYQAFSRLFAIIFAFRPDIFVNVCLPDEPCNPQS